MRKALAVIAVGVVLAACSNDNSTGPDPRNCTAGSIASGDTKTGTLNNTSCLRYDWEYSRDSAFYASYDVKLDSGKAYMFNLQGTPVPTFFDATLELVAADKSTGVDVLLAISDDEGLLGGSNLYFIAPGSGTFSLRVSGYDKSDTASYVLKARSCKVPTPAIVDSLIASSQLLEAGDCMLEKPRFSNDSSPIQLYSIKFAPNETKSVVVTTTAFNPGIQMFGPGFGTFCDYRYQGCMGGQNPDYFTDLVPSNDRVTQQGSIGGTASLVRTADGRYGSNGFGFIGYNDYPGLYVLAVGGLTHGALGAYTLTVRSNPSLGGIGAGIVAPVFGPGLSHLHKKPAFYSTVPQHRKHK